MEYSANRILSAKKEVVMLPEWKADARESGFEAEVLESKLKILAEMLESGEINRRIYDEMYQGFVASRQRLDALLQKLAQRLDELQSSDDGIDLFLTRVRMQGNDPLSYASIKQSCAAMKSTNENERNDLRSVQDLVQRYFAPKSVLPVQTSAAHGEEELVLSSDRNETSSEEEHFDEASEETVPERLGSLKSLRA